MLDLEWVIWRLRLDIYDSWWNWKLLECRVVLLQCLVWLFSNCHEQSHLSWRWHGKNYRYFHCVSYGWNGHRVDGDCGSCETGLICLNDCNGNGKNVSEISFFLWLILVEVNGIGSRRDIWSEIKRCRVPQSIIVVELYHGGRECESSLVLDIGINLEIGRRFGQSIGDVVGKPCDHYQRIL